MNSGESLRMVSVAIVGLGPDRLAVGRDRDRGMQRVRLAAEIEQLAARRLHAVGLGEDRLAEREHLVAADHIGLPGKIAHGLGLGARQNFGNVMRAQRPLAADRLAHHGLVEARRLDDEGEPRRFEDARARLAPRSEDQRRAARLQEAAHASSTGASRS